MNNIKNWKIKSTQGGACDVISGDIVLATFEVKSECIRVIDIANGGVSDGFEWYAIPPYKSDEKWTILNDKGEFVGSFINKKICLSVIRIVSM